MPSVFSPEVRGSFRRPAYVICIVGILTTVIEYIVTILPLAPRAALWRFGVEGMLANVSAMPTLMLTLALVVALGMRDAGALRLIRAAAAIAFAILTLAAIAFMLDMMKVKTNVSADANYNFMFASLIALLKICVQALIAGAIAVAARNALADHGAGTPVSAKARMAEAA